jgi:hypothetical protein
MSHERGPLPVLPSEFSILLSPIQKPASAARLPATRQPIPGLHPGNPLTLRNLTSVPPLVKVMKNALVRRKMRTSHNRKRHPELVPLIIAMKQAGETRICYDNAPQPALQVKSQTKSTT